MVAAMSLAPIVLEYPPVHKCISLLIRRLFAMGWLISSVLTLVFVRINHVLMLVQRLHKPNANHSLVNVPSILPRMIVFYYRKLVLNIKFQPTVGEVKLGNVFGMLRVTIVREHVLILLALMHLPRPPRPNAKHFHKNVPSIQVGLIVTIFKRIVHHILPQNCVHIVFTGNVNGVSQQTAI